MNHQTPNWKLSRFNDSFLPRCVRGAAFGGRSADQRRRKKKHLIEVAPFGRLDKMLRATKRRQKKKHLTEAALFGRLDQMLRTMVPEGVWGRFAPLAENG